MNRAVQFDRDPGGVVSSGRYRRWVDAAFFAWIGLLVASPALLRHGIDHHLHNVYHVQLESHAIVEIFCGMVALLIAGLILTIARYRRDHGIALFGAAFIAMGVLDVLHALTSPTTHAARFVWFHTASVFAGAALTALAMLGYFWTHPRERPSTRSVVWMVGIAVIAIPLFVLNSLGPIGSPHEVYRFSPTANRLHMAASFLYALSALAIYLHYRVTRQALSLLLAILLMLFAESAYLFVFSQMWDVTWWLWHWIKSAFYLATLVIVFVGFVMMLRAVQRSHRHLVVANRELARARGELVDINAELSARNAMARRAVHSLRLDKTLAAISDSLHEAVGSASCELILRLPDDEVEEFQRLAVCQGFGNSISAVGIHASPLCRLDAHGGREPIAVKFFPLYACDEEFGYLRVTPAPDRRASPRENELLHAMAAEAGPLIHNALLYHRSAEDIAFRSSLLWISAQLASSLKLTQVLENVCAESAQLLGSDGTVIWVNSEASERGVYSRCVSDANDHDFIAYEQLYGELLTRVRTEPRPQAILKAEADYVREQSASEHCVWGALALFPLVAPEGLLGLMAVVRRERVGFSRAALQKGEVLAEQVRLALNNARQYAALQQTNRQLRVLEESRLRAERLAALGQMAATVAHEVRNPLAAMSNCLAVLRGAALGETPSQALEIIGDEIARLERLTRNFLTFGRSTGVRHVAVIVAEDFARTARAQLERHIAQEDQRVTVITQVRGSVSTIYFDADGLWEVVWNLLLNAVQAVRDDGKVMLRLRTTATRISIVVCDDGRGIAAADRQRVFDPFFSSKPQGAGLGLAIVHRFVQQWGARLRLRTAVGRGTRFFIRIPLVRAAVTESTAVSTHAASVPS